MILKLSIIAVCLTYCHAKIEIAKYLKICDRNSPDVNDCLVEAIQQGLNTVSDGIADLGVPPIDPYHQDHTKVEYKNNQIVAKMKLKDMTVTGMRASKVHDVRLRADEDQFHLEVDLTSPRIDVAGQYHGEGRFNALTVNATGDFNCTMRDLVYTWKLDGKPEKQGDETFIRITSFYMRPDVGELQAYVSNIFPDNKELTEVANTFANRNWRLMYREMLPHAQANWNKIGTRVANTLFLSVPYNQLFPTST